MERLVASGSQNRQQPGLSKTPNRGIATRAMSQPTPIMEAPEHVGSAVTRAAIERITDEGLFEGLAARVILLDNPLYKGLVETGTNPEGKTINSLVDGIVFFHENDGIRRAVVAAHTITARDRLRGKWLTNKDADIPKSIARLQREMARDPTLRARIVLTSNKEPDDTLVSDVTDAARRAGVDVQLYTNSVIARLLDSSGDGQWIRRDFLNLPLQRLSADLAREISRQMLKDVAPKFEGNTLVARDAASELLADIRQGEGLRFVQGASGVGKSVICYNVCQRIIDAGGVAFVILDSVLSESANLREAALVSLKKYAPEIVETDALGRLNQLFPQSQIIFWVEDINHASAPGREAEKLLRWTDQSNRSGPSSGAFAVLCPIGRRQILGMSREARERVDGQSIVVTQYSRQEGGQAVADGARTAGVELTVLQAESISAQLGHDPLLIGVLTEWRDLDPSKVIADYVEDGLQADDGGEATPGERRAALKQVAFELTRRRVLSPGAGDVLAWGDENYRTAIRALARHGRVISFSGPSTDERLTFRHDRVRDHILIDVFVDMLGKFDSHRELLADPYYSRYVGPALVRGAFAQETFERIADISLTAIFEALKYAATIRAHRVAIGALCERRLKGTNWDATPVSVQYAIHGALAETDAPETLSLIEYTPAPSFPAQFAGVRNGDVRAAARLCFNFDPGRWIMERDRLIAHARDKFGQRWMDELAALIVENPSDERYGVGALYLAGELGEPSLAPAIATRWRAERAAHTPLSDAMLWAAVSCGLDVASFPMDEIVEAWRSLPTKHPEKENSNPRYDVANHVLSGGLLRRGDDKKLDFLTSLGERDEELRHPIRGCLQYINHPKSVEFAAREMARIDEEFGGPENHTGSFGFAGYWGREDEYGGNLSASCRERLRSIWVDTTQSANLRARAFQLWAARLAPGDAAQLAAEPPPGLEDKALVARLWNGDQSAKPALKEKLRADPSSSHWWQYARKVGTDDLEEEIELALEHRRAAQAADSSQYWSGDWILTELLCDRDDAFAFEAIRRHWDQLGSHGSYVQSMLYFATPESITMAYAAIDTAEKPDGLLAHINTHWGVNHVGRPGITRIEQLEALGPYLDRLGWLVVYDLWHACNRRGWGEWRRRHLDPVARKFPRLAAFVSDDAAFDWIDNEISSASRIGFAAHCWMDSRLREGESASDSLDLLEKYANDRRTVEAITFLTEAIREHGHRLDLCRLEFPWAKGSAQIQKLLRDVRFSVEHRSLS